MTQFDLLVLALLLVSAAVGFARGATREMVTVLAFLFAAMIALFGLRFVGPAARAAIDPDWAGDVAAVVGIFLGAYIALRLLGTAVTQRVRKTPVVGTLDRTIGLGFGLIRALVVLGAFHLLLNVATPPERMPRWITAAALYPLTAASAQLLAAFAPQSADVAGRLRPAWGQTSRDGTGDRSTQQGYDARERGEIDELVEKSR